jgi:hypothetical protein
MRSLPETQFDAVLIKVEMGHGCEFWAFGVWVPFQARHTKSMTRDATNPRSGLSGRHKGKKDHGIVSSETPADRANIGAWIPAQSE